MSDDLSRLLEKAGRDLRLMQRLLEGTEHDLSRLSAVKVLAELIAADIGVWLARVTSDSHHNRTE